MLKLYNSRKSEHFSNEGWGYKINSYEDVLEINYFEEVDGQEVLKSQITFPTDVVEKVLGDAIFLNSKRKKVSDNE